MVADLETFAKVRALHDRTDSPGEKTAAMLKMQTLARKAGMSVEQAVSTLDRAPPKAPAGPSFADIFDTPFFREAKAERDRERAIRCRELIAEYGSEAAVWADTDREAALRRACEPLLGPGQGWDTIYRLDGWGMLDFRATMPESVRRAVTEAWPLPTTTAAAWAEFEAADKRESDRAAFCPNYSPHAWAEARRYLLEDLCRTLPAYSLHDIRARLSWIEFAARQGFSQGWEEQEPTLTALRADIERMGTRLRERDAEAVQNGHPPPQGGEGFTSKSQNSWSGCDGVQDGQQQGAASDAYLLRRTNAEKRAAVLALFGQGLTDREIARRAGVSPQTVGNIRRRV